MQKLKKLKYLGKEKCFQSTLKVLISSNDLSCPPNLLLNQNQPIRLDSSQQRKRPKNKMKIKTALALM